MSILDVLPCQNKDFTLINVEKKAFRNDPSQELESWFNAKKSMSCACGSELQFLHSHKKPSENTHTCTSGTVVEGDKSISGVFWLPAKLHIQLDTVAKK